MTERYIHIRNWDRHQHPDVTRNKKTAAPWIKEKSEQLNHEDFLELGFADRGLLHSLRLQYALTRGRGINDTTTNLSRLLGQRVYRSQLERLNHAGFIMFSASKSLATRLQPASLDVDVDEDIEKTKGLFVSRPPAPPSTFGANGQGENDLDHELLGAFSDTQPEEDE
jgi:hypothetical protein